MKVEQELLNVEVNVESDRCTLEATPELFDALVANVYKDRTMAPVRELSANAGDAHRLVGKAQIPFEVHGPNSLEPHFSVRDFGPGMSHQQMMDVYKKIGKSDKIATNDLVGYMGIGSKSPFAYVDNYVVISYQNGKKSQYVCFRDEERFPAISKPQIEDTTEENGLEVRFAVRNWDTYEFASKIKNAFRFYKTKPVVKGIANFEHMTSEYLIKNEEYGVTKNREESMVVMGQISYPIEIKDFAKKNPQGHVVSNDWGDDTTDDTIGAEDGAVYLNSKEKKLIKWGIHLFVPIGSVALAPNRETLTYTPKVRAFVKSILAKAVAATEAEANKALHDAKTVWEARCLFGQVRNGVIGEICDFDNTNFIEWQGRNVSNVIIASDYEVYPNIEVLSTEENEGGYRRRRRYGNTTPNVTNSGNGLKRWHTDRFSAEDYDVIFVNDLNRGGYAAARRYMEEHNVDKALMFSSAVDSFIDEVGCRHLLINVSTLPKPERKKCGPRGSQDRSLIQEWSPSGFSDTEIDLEDGGIYVEIRRDKIKRPLGFKNEFFDFHYLSCITSFVSDMRKLGNDDTIYGIRPCDLPRLQRHKDEWETLDQALEDMLRQNACLLDAARAKLTMENLDTKVQSLSSLNLEEGSVLKEAIDAVDDCAQAKSDKVEAFIRLNNYVKLFEIKPFATPAAKVKKVYETYPLLKSLSYWTDNLKAIEQYVRLVDEENEKKVAKVA